MATKKTEQPKTNKQKKSTLDSGQEQLEEQQDHDETQVAAKKLTTRSRPPLKPREVRALQRTVGNTVVDRLLSKRRRSITRREGGPWATVQRIPIDVSAADLATELHGIFTGDETGPHYARLDEILVQVTGQQQLERLRAVYNAYPGGGRQFMTDLGAFCGRIPVHPGQDPVANRQSFLDRWTAKLYDAGIRRVQEQFGSARPVLPTAQNLGQWRNLWRQYYVGGDGRGRSEKQMALWIINHWGVVTGSGAVPDLIAACGFTIPTAGDDHSASYSILSSQPAAHAAAIIAGQNYFATIAGTYSSGLGRLVGDAQSYNQSYVAANFPLWQNRTIAFNWDLDVRIINWQQLNLHLPIPLVLGTERAQVIALHTLVTEVWPQGNYPRSELLAQAGIRQASAAP